MDVANARFVEDVEASFQRNCMDLQKSQIFYKAVRTLATSTAVSLTLPPSSLCRSLFLSVYLSVYYARCCSVAFL